MKLVKHYSVGGDENVSKQREPIDAILAKGKKHLTKSEIERRRDTELKVVCDRVEPPQYLTRSQKYQFRQIAAKLVAINIFTDLDVDCLSRYILAHEQYLQLNGELAKMLSVGSLDIEALKSLQLMQDRAFKQAQSSARDLGLTVTSRCKIVVPAPPPEDDDEL